MVRKWLILGAALLVHASSMAADATVSFDPEPYLPGDYKGGLQVIGYYETTDEEGNSIPEELYYNPKDGQFYYEDGETPYEFPEGSTPEAFEALGRVKALEWSVGDLTNKYASAMRQIKKVVDDLASHAGQAVSDGGPGGTVKTHPGSKVCTLYIGGKYPILPQYTWNAASKSFSEVPSDITTCAVGFSGLSTSLGAEKSAIDWMLGHRTGELTVVTGIEGGANGNVNVTIKTLTFENGLLKAAQDPDPAFTTFSVKACSDDCNHDGGGDGGDGSGCTCTLKTSADETDPIWNREKTLYTLKTDFEALKARVEQAEADIDALEVWKFDAENRLQYVEGKVSWAASCIHTLWLGGNTPENMPPEL